MSNVIKLDRKSPQRALEALNRMTGLVFDHWPESLVGLTAEEQPDRHPSNSSNALVLVRKRANAQ
ncbi:MAG: hypothetical protein V2I38_15020 [Alcanivoracaceae bacterium]|jgi:hypothetical protein|nr:hypothetical protein [Alcanivoracaceae bacterium]